MRRFGSFCWGILLLGVVACDRPPSAKKVGWERFDLWVMDARVERPHPRGRWRRASRREMSFLGLEEVRDLSRVPPRGLENHPRQSAGQIRALRQVVGSRLAWRLQLAGQPYLSFVPLGDDAASCNGCVYRVSVRSKGGEVRELVRHEVGPIANPARETVVVDLSDHAQRVIDLLVEVDGEFDGDGDQPAPTALWGSLAVYTHNGEPPASIAARPPNIILLGADTLRADALGIYGRQLSLTPALDSLAAESDVWLEAFSVFNVTNPSFISMLTGLYGKNHRIYGFTRALPDSHTTLAELLSDEGYETLAIIAAHHLGDRFSGLGQGFDNVTESEVLFAAEVVVDMAMDWISVREGPFFAWLHFFDPHTPHTPPEPYALGLRPSGSPGLGRVVSWSPFREVGSRPYIEPVLAGHEDLYDGEVAYLDRQIGRFVDFLRSRGLLQNTVLVFVADHGENLHEHNLFCHHAGLWDTTTRVPLMIRWPGREQQGRLIPGMVETIDLFPTLLAAAGVEIPVQDGVDLRELTGGGRPGRRVVFSEHANDLGVAIRSQTHRYFESVGHSLVPKGNFLYDLREDPEETNDVATEQPEVAAELATALDRWLGERRQEIPTPESRELSPEDLDRLRTLGYVQ